MLKLFRKKQKQPVAMRSNRATSGVRDPVKCSTMIEPLGRHSIINLDENLAPYENQKFTSFKPEYMGSMPDLLENEPRGSGTSPVRAAPVKRGVRPRSEMSEPAQLNHFVFKEKQQAPPPPKRVSSEKSEFNVHSDKILFPGENDVFVNENAINNDSYVSGCGRRAYSEENLLDIRSHVDHDADIVSHQVTPLESPRSVGYSETESSQSQEEHQVGRSSRASSMNTPPTAPPRKKRGKLVSLIKGFGQKMTHSPRNETRRHSETSSISTTGSVTQHVSTSGERNDFASSATQDLYTDQSKTLWSEPTLVMRPVTLPYVSNNHQAPPGGVIHNSRSPVEVATPRAIQSPTLNSYFSGPAGRHSAELVLVEADYTPINVLSATDNSPQDRTFLREQYSAGPGRRRFSEGSNVVIPAEVADVRREKWQGKRVAAWNNADLIQWCETIQLPRLGQKLQDCGITASCLLKINRDDLVALGLTNDGAIERVQQEVDRLRRRSIESTSRQLRPVQSPYNKGVQPPGENVLTDSGLEELLPLDTSTAEDRNQTKLNRRLSTSAESLIAQARNKVGLYRRRSSLGELYESSMERHVRKVPLAKWTQKDVLNWLRYVGLKQFVSTFQAHNITGRDLADVNIQMFDDIGISSTEDREIILSKLYQLQHPDEPSLEELISSQLSQSRVTSTTTDEPSLEELISSQLSQSRVTSSTTASNDYPSDKDTTAVHSNDQLPRQDNADQQSITCKVCLSQAGDPTKIEVHHSLTSPQGIAVVSLDDSTTCGEVLEGVLAKCNVHDDRNLYNLVRTTTEGGEEVLGSGECPVAIQRIWPGGESHIFKLRKNKGKKIKVVCHVEGGRPKGKSCEIATVSTCAEVITTALRRFKIKKPPAHAYFFIEVNRDSGATRTLQPNDVISNLQSECFVLCEKAKMDSLSAPDIITRLKKHSLSHSRSNSDMSDGVPQNYHCVSDIQADDGDRAAEDSKMSHGAASFPGACGRLGICHQDCRRVSSPPKPVRKFNQNSTGRTNHNVTASKDTPQFTNKTIELSDEGYHHSNGRMLPGELASDYRKLTPHKENNCKESKRHRHKPRSKSSNNNLELLREIALLKTTLSDRDQEIKELLRDNRNVTHHPAQVDSCPSLYSALSGLPSQCARRVELNSSSRRAGFLLGTDQQNRPMIKHADESSGLLKSDRLLEVDGTQVLGMNEAQILSLIHDGLQTSAKIVILREAPRGRAEEEDSLKDDLQLAMMELESLQQENADLHRELARKILGNGSDEGMEGLTDVKRKLEVAESQWQQLYQLVGEASQTDEDSEQWNVIKAFILNVQQQNQNGNNHEEEETNIKQESSRPRPVSIHKLSL